MTEKEVLEEVKGRKLGLPDQENQTWWCMPIIPAFKKAEAGGQKI
ncbi:hypothetical protein LEMLEM_LOCUS2455, partial [Lemmus lemmus]